jgi:hypothetical protein
LDADALDDLRVAQAGEDASGYVAGGFGADLGEDDEGGEAEGEEGADDE